MKLVKDENQIISKKNEISDEEAEKAIKTIIQWLGEDPEREGLLSTPKRVVKVSIYPRHLPKLTVTMTW